LSDELPQRHDQDAVDLVGAGLQVREPTCRRHEGKHRDEATRGVHYWELAQHLDGSGRQRHLFTRLAKCRRER
jgi:hypothetical protein